MEYVRDSEAQERAYASHQEVVLFLGQGAARSGFPKLGNFESKTWNTMPDSIGGLARLNSRTRFQWSSVQTGVQMLQEGYCQLERE